MTITYFPFDSGAGATSREDRWRLMASLWRDTGIIEGLLNNLQCYADSTGMQVKVKGGVAWIEGFYFSSDAETILTISTSDPTNPRIDYVTARVDWDTNTIGFVIIVGTPAASPSAPSLLNTATQYDMPIAKVTVPAAAVTIAAGNVLDARITSASAGASIGLVIALG